MTAITSLGHQNVTAITNAAAQSLTMPTGKRPCHALIQAGSVAVRWRADGTAPTTTVGILLAANSYLDFTDPMGDYATVINKIQFISSGADSTLNVEYFT